MSRPKRSEKYTPYGESLTDILMIRLSPEQLAKLEKLASSHRLYPSTYLRTLLEKHLKAVA